MDMKSFKLDLDNLPNTVEELKAVVIFLVQHIAKQDAIIESQQAQIHQLQRIVFGRRSEKSKNKQDRASDENETLGRSPGDLDTTKGSKTDQQSDLKTKNRGSTGRQKRTNLPRERVEHDIPESQKVCQCGNPRCKIGEEVTEQLEHCPASYKIIEHVRFKYGCAFCKEGVVIAPLPSQPIDKGLAGPGLLAHILISKYTDHLPLYRMEKIFKRYGTVIARSTQCDWVHQCAILLKPIYKGLKEWAVQASHMHTDDTLAPTLNPGLGKTLTGRMWVYIACFLSGFRVVIYDYRTDRSSDGPVNFLKKFVGYLQADAYAGYDACYKLYKIIEVACWAHARRKFYEIAHRIKTPGISHKALDFIKQLYEVEKKTKDMTSDDRKGIRQTESKPILGSFKIWLDEQALIVPPAGALGLAIQYARNHWTAFNTYLEEGWLNIDNNLAERKMKIIALGRKNYMFFGSEVGGENAAIIYSIIETCLINDVEPYAYLRDVLARLPTHLNKDLAQLFPHNWKADQDAISTKIETKAA
jgi:transposase